MNNSQLIIKMFKNNISIRKIAKTLSLTTCAVYECLYNNGFSHFNDKNESRDKSVCELYEKGYKITEIANELRIDRHTVTHILKKYGIYKRLTVEEKEIRDQKVISYYNSGKSTREVAKEMNISAAGVTLILKKHNIKLREQHQKGHSKGTSKNRKYFFNFDFFENIDTEEKAYWLGFLYADGYVSYKGYMYLALQEKDLNHLKKFAKSIEAKNIPIKYTPRTKSYGISLCSIKMQEDLMHLGCFFNKSLILKFPTENQVPRYLINHFMRGYFDGDGCIYVSDKTKTFSVLGTPDFLNEYENILLNNCKNKHKTKRTHRDIWNENTEEIIYGGSNRVKEIYDFLYKNANIYLERKKNKFQFI